MAENLMLIPEIVPNLKKWQAKIIVAEKLAPKQARQGNSRYQNMVLMDLSGNKVHATLYDANITALEDQLLLGKTYIISNAVVKDTKPEYRSSSGDVQWIISGKTRVQELNEDNMEFLFSTYTFTPFQDLEKHMDSNEDISILGIAINMRPKRLIQTRFGSQTYVQDIVLIDQNFHITTMTMWDNYVENECVLIAEIIAKKPVVLAHRVKVSSFNGLTLSTKVNSTFFIDAAFTRVAELRAWVENHAKLLNDIALEKPMLAVTPTKLSPPAPKKISSIKSIQGRKLGRKYYWIQANSNFPIKNQSFWYMSCSNCNKVTHADFNETFQCIYCKYPFAKAVSRANATILLEDKTGSLTATVIEEPAEILFKCTAEHLMIHSKKEPLSSIDEVIHIDNEDHLFYVKVTRMDVNTNQYKYEIIFVLDLVENFTDGEESSAVKETDNSFIDESSTSFDSQELLPPSAKRALFHDDSTLSSTHKKPEHATSSSEGGDVASKAKLE